MKATRLASSGSANFLASFASGALISVWQDLNGFGVIGSFSSLSKILPSGIRGILKVEGF